MYLVCLIIVRENHSRQSSVQTFSHRCGDKKMHILPLNFILNFFELKVCMVQQWISKTVCSSVWLVASLHTWQKLGMMLGFYLTLCLIILIQISHIVFEASGFIMQYLCIIDIELCISYDILIYLHYKNSHHYL